MGLFLSLQILNDHTADWSRVSLSEAQIRKHFFLSDTDLPPRQRLLVVPPLLGYASPEYVCTYFPFVFVSSADMGSQTISCAVIELLILIPSMNTTRTRTI